MKKIFFIAVFIFIFTGCNQPQPPKWFINTPNDSSIYFYASSSAYSKENAVKQALNSIASRINVKISSDFVINKGIHNKKTYNDIYQQINTQIQNIDFNNYKILKTKKENKKIYILIRVNKQQLKNSLKNKIDIQLNSINFQADTSIKKIIKAYKVLKKLKKIESEIFIIESLGENINVYINKIKNCRKKAKNIISNTKFKLMSNKYKLQNEEILLRYINLNKNAKNKIKITINTEKLRLFNYYIIKGTALVYLNKPYLITFLGKSQTSYKEAETFAKNEYKKRLKKLLKQIF